MKKLLTLMLTVITVGCFGQTDTSKTVTIKAVDVTPVENSPYVNSFKSNTNLHFSDDLVYTNGSGNMLYTIKKDGSIELGDKLIEAVIKGLEMKGYVLRKRDDMGMGVKRFSDSVIIKHLNTKK